MIMHHRRSIRLRGYDYTQPGAYFMTIVTRGREHLFGAIVDGEMRLNEAGQLVADCWSRIPRHFPFAAVDSFIVMPNHLHGIIIINGDGRGEASTERSWTISGASVDASPLQPRPHGTAPGSLAAIVQNVKSVSTRRINATRQADGSPIWQRNYYEHIIRSNTSLNRIREYIVDNPARWDTDSENPVVR
ncbi:MAG: transposase [Chloroflexi bacterium]|nr:transposase [Chloroflexota bacterium]